VDFDGHAGILATAFGLPVGTAISDISDRPTARKCNGGNFLQRGEMPARFEISTIAIG
jgi:hypothetical protein